MPNEIRDNPEILRARLGDLLETDTSRSIRHAAGNRSCHLVGGVLRDLALGRQARDLDVVVAGDGAAIAERLAAELGGRSIPLGGRRFAAYRIAWSGLVIDIWDRGSDSLESDLRRRDFTVHSFALNLHTGEIVDPFSGLVDLIHRRLRMTTLESFTLDPLRILRLCRFLAQLEEFQIDPATWIRAGEGVGGLQGVASERIQTEIEMTLAQVRFAAAAEIWIDLKILPGILLASSADPDSRSRLLRNLSLAFDRLDQTASLLPDLKHPESVRLATLLELISEAGIGSPGDALHDLLGRGFVAKALAQRVAHLLDLGTLPSTLPKQRWFLYRAAERWPEALSLAAATAPPAAADKRDISQVVRLATDRPDEIFDPPPLISGHDLQAHLKMRPGAALGGILDTIRRLQIEGSVSTRTAALDLATRLATRANQE